MKYVVGLIAAVCTSAAVAGPEISSTTPRTVDTHFVPIDTVETETSYVFESDLNHGGSFGKQDALENSVEYGHRFLLTGNWYVRAGLAYQRFDFGQTSALPIPDHLQSAALLLGIDYMHGEDIGAFFQIRPGFYFENDINSASFDVPITAARIFVLRDDELYFFAGVNASFLRGGLPVVPLAGLIWTPNKQWHAVAMVPEPRIVYSPNNQWDFWLGGELLGGSFRLDDHDEFQGIPHVAKLSGTQVDYMEYRTGLGVVYSPTDNICFDLGAGYAVERAFKFHRAGENYRTDPAPYLRLVFKAKF
ncbi:MAG: hypothetical protein ACJ8KU_03625 [Chthoniobacterales bacterium]